MKKKTLLIGASTNPARYSYMVTHRLVAAGHPVVLLGRKKGEVAGMAILNNKEDIKEIHTVTLYLGTKHQSEYEEFLLKLKPKRVIFNPGTENPELLQKLIEANIDAFEACTLVMLSTGQF